ncbi:hypothetical protein FG573_024380 [Salmonella enterica subsp. enterica serovar Derby]|nr:hypothetical protein FG573_024380 [Salmonella enterica subsp. enterica serovar Derby]
MGISAAMLSERNSEPLESGIYVRVHPHAAASVMCYFPALLALASAGDEAKASKPREMLTMWVTETEDEHRRLLRRWRRSGGLSAVAPVRWIMKER